MSEALRVTTLLLIAASGTIVVLIREPDRQSLASGIFGLCLAISFFAFQAPDVALSQLVVGTFALPAMILLALGKIGRQAEARSRDETPDDR